jgi:hypothetical protein
VIWDFKFCTNGHVVGRVFILLMIGHNAMPYNFSGPFILKKDIVTHISPDRFEREINKCIIRAFRRSG